MALPHQLQTPQIMLCLHFLHIFDVIRILLITADETGVEIGQNQKATAMAAVFSHFTVC
jgi:hypothetical protein